MLLSTTGKALSLTSKLLFQKLKMDVNSLIPTSDNSDYDEKKFVGRKILLISITRATVFDAYDSNGLADPYVRVKNNEGKLLFSTPVVSKTLEPKWTETYEISLQDTVDSLTIEILDKDMLVDDFIGKGTFDYYQIRKEPLRYKLEKDILTYKKDGDHDPSASVHVTIIEPCYYNPDI
ncbi:C2 domain-containing protein [Tieghemostelium lacteum]|uniref:C2 domain-containing protein n=1 Tax=Tieghemostelium lacteum TaxID=361077 RepID=A0A151Z5L9_TIELA|nr:C2 domain-containing protein [Tieghemostelium lacteum]|eukprot:KYQ89217.1 C2 domain-containing protein [Tieghemostelium lacteum]